MFSFFKKAKKQLSRDLIWMSKTAKYYNLVQAVSSTADDQVCIVATSFRDSLSEIQRMLAGAGIASSEFASLSASSVSYGKRVNLLLISDLLSAPNQIAELGGAKVRFILWEHYPVKQKNDFILERIHQMFPQILVEVFVSLDDPLMQTFGSGRLKEIISRLGMGENEMLEHSMISKSIERALQKVQNGISSEQTTDNEERWYALNVKQTNQ